MLAKLAWYQLITEKRRLLAALGGIAFAALLQLVQSGFRDALFTVALVNSASRNPDCTSCKSAANAIPPSAARSRRFSVISWYQASLASMAPDRAATAGLRRQHGD